MRQFAILEHRWDGVHFDLMFEVDADSALRTWALDEAPTPGRPIAARGLADHRRAYLDYEGSVSSGRGTVRRLDRGTYTVVEWSETRIEVVLAGDWLVGPMFLERVGPPAQSGRPVEPDWVFWFGNRD